MMKGKHHTEETKQKLRKIRSGCKRSEETKRKIGSKQIGELNHNYGKVTSPEVKQKISLAMKGRKYSLEHREKISRARFREGNGNWKGGISPKNARIRNSIDSRLWREAIFARDNWTCQKCKIRGKRLHSHHIQNFAQYPELRFAIDNGITFCDKCHKEFHNRFGLKNNNREQIMEFLS